MHQQLDYKALSKGDRYYAMLTINTLIGVFRILSIIDTGALYTVFPYKCFLTDTSAIRTGEHKVLSGAVKSSLFNIHEVRVNKCLVGPIDIGTQFPYITFDENIDTSVLGMDLLKRLDILHFATQHALYLQKPGQQFECVFSSFDKVDNSNIHIAIRQAANELHATINTVKGFIKCLPERVDMKYWQLCGLFDDYVSRAS